MKSKKAFTLIELLIVIAIIGILAAVIFVSLNTARKKAQDTQVKSDLTSLSQALEIVKIDRALTATAWTYVVDNTSSVTDANISRWTDTATPGTGNRLVSKLPVNPFGGQYYIKVDSSSDYWLLSRLNSSTSYYCIAKGSASIVNSDSASGALTACAAN